MNRIRMAIAAVVLVSLAVPGLATEGKYTLKHADVPPPAELKEPVRGLLLPRAAQISDAGGQLLCEVWFRKSIPAKATPAQVQNGLTYREIDETTIIGAIRFTQAASDYRKQKIKPGVYTIRLAFQPQDGDHMGTAPYSEFCLLVAADKDVKPDVMDAKALHSASMAAMDSSHPGALLLFPNEKPADEAKLADQGMGHWVLKQKLEANVNGKPAPLGIGLTLIGHSSAG